MSTSSIKGHTNAPSHQNLFQMRWKDQNQFCQILTVIARRAEPISLREIGVLKDKTIRKIVIHPGEVQFFYNPFKTKNPDDLSDFEVRNSCPYQIQQKNLKWSIQEPETNPFSRKDPDLDILIDAEPAPKFQVAPSNEEQKKPSDRSESAASKEEMKELISTLHEIRDDVKKLVINTNPQYTDAHNETAGILMTPEGSSGTLETVSPSEIPDEADEGLGLGKTFGEQFRQSLWSLRRKAETARQPSGGTAPTEAPSLLCALLAGHPAGERNRSPSADSKQYTLKKERKPLPVPIKDVPQRGAHRRARSSASSKGGLRFKQRESHPTSGSRKSQHSAAPKGALRRALSPPIASSKRHEFLKKGAGQQLLKSRGPQPQKGGQNEQQHVHSPRKKPSQREHRRVRPESSRREHHSSRVDSLRSHSASLKNTRSALSGGRPREKSLPKLVRFAAQ